MTFGERMRAKRKAAGLTLVELGEKVGYSHAALSALETGRSNGGQGCAKAVKAFLGLRGCKMAKTKKPAKAPRKPKAAPEAMERADATLTALGLLLGGLTRLADSVDAMTGVLAASNMAQWAYKPTAAAVEQVSGSALTALVPSVAEQRARTEAMTKEMAKNGLNGGVPVTASLGDLRGLGNFHAG